MLQNDSGTNLRKISSELVGFWTRIYEELLQREKLIKSVGMMASGVLP